MLKLQFLRNVSIRVRLFALTAILCLFTAGASFVGYQRLAAADTLDGQAYTALSEQGRDTVMALHAQGHYLLLVDEAH